MYIAGEQFLSGRHERESASKSGFELMEMSILFFVCLAGSVMSL